MGRPAGSGLLGARYLSLSLITQHTPARPLDLCRAVESATPVAIGVSRVPFRRAARARRVALVSCTRGDSLGSFAGPSSKRGARERARGGSLRRAVRGPKSSTAASAADEGGGSREANARESPYARRERPFLER